MLRGVTLILSVAWCSVGSLAIAQSAGTSAPQSASRGYAGSQACRTCHPDITSTFFRNPHYKSQVNDSLPPEKQGCEGCHGPGKDHVEAKGDKTKIFAFSLKPASEILDNCLRCHNQTMSRANIRRSSHTNANVVCNGCHSIHKSTAPKALLAKQQQSEVCYGCHTNIRAQFSMPFKHRVNEGFMSCSDCHNPHGTSAPTWRTGSRPRMVDQGLSNEQACLRCHTDKRGPFVFEHAAVRVDGCETCHNPHGSPNAKLLKRPTAFALCLECHNGAPGFGRTGQGTPTQSASHNMADPRYHNCVSCHIRVHGSNSNQKLLR